MTERTIASLSFGSTDTASTSAGAVKAKTESQTLVSANPTRIALHVTNDGEKTVYLALGATATKSKGIRLNEKGGYVAITGYTGVVSVVTAEGEAVTTFCEV